MHNYIQNEQLSYIYSMFSIKESVYFPIFSRSILGLLGSTYNSSIN